ncbi:Hsp33 family molecular chaperone HslO [Anaeromicrobium sediminis]|uniref:33 kDa chaperonin n=1 Tax=Anaeromicrobium sediminis TaxID=1478221 RepID=A0A267MKJ7_9FIRM|nr:Hsp33 family molecular chaperone HslO [Anaeromicrobium sediminis]PAB59448.1 redox-regulated molecular chaperone Hsp33 [Anaeromicrobium sediminis]
MSNYVVRAVAANKSIRVFAAVTTDLVEKARGFHNTTPVATAALGRTLTATSIMGLMLKGDNNKLSVQIKGNGPIKQILTTSDSKGIVKGYVSNPYVDIPLKANGKLDVGGAVGSQGRMTVIKDLGLKDPYVGQSDLVSGEIAEDFTYYFANSEQQPSAVALGVLVDRDYTVKVAGGVIIQLLPNTDDETITKIEEALKNAPQITKVLSEEDTPEKVLTTYLKGLDIEILEKVQVDFECDCSFEKLERALISIGEKDLKSIIEEDEKAELTCHFCNTKYNFDKVHLTRLYEEIKK